METNTIRIVMLGNSITNAGNWNELLGRKDVLNAGLSGWTTGELLKVVNKYIAPHKPIICFYKAGINDFSMGIGSESVEKNNKQILESIYEYGTMPVYQTLLYYFGDNFINREIDALNRRMEEFTKHRGFEFLDLRPYLCRNGDLREEYSYDGVHLTESAYIPWANALIPIIEKYGI